MLYTFFIFFLYICIYIFCVFSALFCILFHVSVVCLLYFCICTYFFFVRIFNEFVVNMCVIYLQAPLATWRGSILLSPLTSLLSLYAPVSILHALRRDSFVADICRYFCEICASLLIKNCVYLHICSTNLPPTLPRPV